MFIIFISSDINQRATSLFKGDPMSVDDDDDMECSDEFHYMMDQSLA